MVQLHSLPQTIKMMCNMTFRSCDATGTCNGIINGTTAFIRLTIKIRCNMTFLDMWHHQHWHHMLPTALSMGPLHSLNHDDGNDVLHDFWQCDAMGISMT